jgi:hypothetical protein
LISSQGKEVMAMRARLDSARTQVRKRLTALFAGGVVAGLAIAPAGPASATDGAVGTRCSPAHEEYSRDKWQYAKFSICAEKQDTRILYRISVTELQYYWGSHWYYNKYWAGIKTSLVVHRDGRTITSSVSSGATPGGKTVASDGTFEVTVPGVYRLIAQADVRGQYWTEGHDSRVLTVPFSVEFIVA